MSMTQNISSQRKRSNPPPKKKSTGPNKTLFIAIVIIIIGIVGISAGMWIMNTLSSQDEGDAIAVIDTSKGVIKIDLYEDIVPETCENFIKLANDGFYDGMIFHRVQDDFMIQVGNTYPDGSTEQSPYGNIAFESNDTISHVDGAISMASTGAGLGGSSQFFICDGAQSSLDGSYAVFGETIEGIDVVRDIADEPHDNSYGSVGGGRPNIDIIINSIIIEYE